jgi:hypothetical protein
VYGTLLAQSVCQNAVITALLRQGTWHTVRQRLREWLYDGVDKADPCRTQVEVSACFAPLLRWVLAWWHGETLALALDATAHGEMVVALVISVLYRSNAIPIAWEILPVNQPGAWMEDSSRALQSERVPVGSDAREHSMALDLRRPLSGPGPAPALHAKNRHHARDTGGQQRQRIPPLQSPLRGRRGL